MRYALYERYENYSFRAVHRLVGCDEGTGTELLVRIRPDYWSVVDPLQAQFGLNCQL